MALLRPFTRSLSSRVLGLTILFVLVAETLVFLPSLAAFHRNWLQERVNAAQIAALALEAAPGMDITQSLRRELLENAEVKRVALKRDGARELRLDMPLPAEGMPPVRTIDLRQMMMVQSAYSAVEAMFSPHGRLLRVLAAPRFESGEFIEVVMMEAPLKREMTAYAIRMLIISVLLTAAIATLVYFTLNAALVRPMRRLTAHIERFRALPEDVTRDIRPSGREDEIGRAESALAAMEAQVRGALRQRERLAGLGAAVAKLAHDLRNSLATAQLITERLSASEDPKVRQAAPRLERAIARAGGLAEAALRYGRAEEPTPALETVPLQRALDEAAAEALFVHPNVQWRNEIASDAEALADGEYLHRIFVNLMRNAAQAGGEAKICVTARRRAGVQALVIDVADSGPGVPEAAQAHLFTPFSVASRNGGSGLGLAIARELARAMGGDLTLASSSAEGAVFAVSLRRPPAR